MGLFDGLESLGLDHFQNAELFAPTPSRQKKSANDPGGAPADDPMNYLYLKEFECPVCEQNFHNYIIRRSKLRLIGLDTDLKPNYSVIDSTRYEVLVCAHCGYAALVSAFRCISDRQAERIKSEISPRFKPREYQMPLSLEDAIERFKLALLIAVTKGVKAGEKAILCLKIAWLYRDLKDAENEQLFLRNAFTGLKLAYESESFPIGAMDANNTQYMIAELARRTGEDAEAMRWISALVVTRGLPKHLKERAQALKDLIRASHSTA